MEEIILRIHQVSELIENVSSASNEQSVGIDQVDLAVTHMDAALSKMPRFLSIPPLQRRLYRRRAKGCLPVSA